MDQQEWDPEAETEMYWQQKHHNVCEEYNAQHWENARNEWHYKVQLERKDEEIARLRNELLRAMRACSALRRELGMEAVDLTTRDTLNWHH